MQLARSTDRAGSGGGDRGRGRRRRLAARRCWSAGRIPTAAGRRRPGGRRRRRLDVGARSSTNVEHALPAGNRAFVLATTGWDADLGRIRGRLIEHGAAAVVAPNLSLGAALFLRLAETAAGWYARAGSFEPSIVEWHRRGKADRPSGTARALARRIVAGRSALVDRATTTGRSPGRSRSSGSAPAPRPGRTS